MIAFGFLALVVFLHDPAWSQQRLDGQIYLGVIQPTSETHLQHWQMGPAAGLGLNYALISNSVKSAGVNLTSRVLYMRMPHSGKDPQFSQNTNFTRLGKVEPSHAVEFSGGVEFRGPRSWLGLILSMSGGTYYVQSGSIEIIEDFFGFPQTRLAVERKQMYMPFFSPGLGLEFNIGDRYQIKLESKMAIGEDSKIIAYPFTTSFGW